MRCNRRQRLARCVILIMLVLGLLAPALPVAAADLSVQQNSATVTFPTQLAFSLVADAPGPVASAEVWYRPAFSPVTSVVRGSAGSGTHLDVTIPVDMQLNYLPPGLDILYHWRVTLQDGSVLETPEQTVLYMDTRYQWKTASADPVTVYYFPGDEKLGQEALKTTLDAINQLKEQFKIAANDPLRVVLYGSTSDFASALPPNSAEWIGGFAEPQLNLVVTGVQPGGDATTEVHRVLSHEVVHLVVHQATENAFNSPPPWLDEGLATYYQTVPDSRFAPILHDAVNSGRLISIRALNSSFPDDPNQAILSYAESESIVHFILQEKGNDRMSALLNAYRGGVSNDEAAQSAFGISLDELDQQWKAWLGYGGDQPISASTDSEGNGAGPGRFIDELLASAGQDLIMGTAALLVLVLALRFAARSRKARDPNA